MLSPCFTSVTFERCEKCRRQTSATDSFASECVRPDVCVTLNQTAFISAYLCQPRRGTVLMSGRSGGGRTAGSARGQL